MATSFRNYSLDLHDQTLGQAHFRCVALHQLVQDNPVFVGVKPGMYCFEVDKPALRVKITSDFVYQALYNDLHLFQNHYIADNIRITRNSEPLLNIHVENIESLTTVQDADFIAPADAVQPDFQSRRIVGSLDARSILRRDPPVYPVGARAMGVHGIVVIQATIGKDGHTGDLHVISGPSLLQQAALDAVSHWLYKPVLLNGQPVEIETQISVNF
jgi:TonB family protein